MGSGGEGRGREGDGKEKWGRGRRRREELGNEEERPMDRLNKIIYSTDLQISFVITTK